MKFIWLNSQYVAAVMLDLCKTVKTIDYLFVVRVYCTRAYAMQCCLV